MRCAPAESANGRLLRFVLASDPTGVADRIQEAEQESIIDLSGAWFVASRVVCDLHMRDLLQMRLDRVCELALHSLHMIDVVLQKKIVRSDIANDVERLTGARQKETGNVECVDRLGQELDAGRAELIGSEPKVGDKCCAQGLDIDSLRRDPGQAVELHATERRGVFD